MKHRYLIRGECLDCHNHVRVVKQFDERVAEGEEIPLSYDYCPHCGAERPSWCQHEQSKIAEVSPSQRQFSTEELGNGPYQHRNP